jgi:hypothetical protein
MACQGLEPQRTADTCIASIDMLTSFIGDLLSFIFVEADVMLVRTGSYNGREKEEENKEKGAASPAVRRGGTCKVHEVMTKRLGLEALPGVPVSKLCFTSVVNVANFIAQSLYLVIPHPLPLPLPQLVVQA